MEHSESKFEKVHVLKQTFRPNEPLRAALAKLMTSGPNGPRPFSIFGSKERVIDVEDTFGKELNVQQREVEQFMASKRNIHLELEPEVSGTIKSNTRGALALQLVMQPANKLEYLRIQQGLDIIQLGRRSRAVGFEAMQLYAFIPVENGLSFLKIERGLAEINDTLSNKSTRRLYQLTPEPFLLGRSITRPVPKVEDANYPKADAP